MGIVSPLEAYRFAYSKKGLYFTDDMMITKNFKWKECFKGEDPKNIPNFQIFSNLLKSFIELQKLRDKLKLPIEVTNAYRSVLHNIEAGSRSPLSCHIDGRAVDFVVIGLPVAQTRCILISSKEIKVRIENNTPTWNHIDIGNPYITNGLKLGLFNP